MLRLEPVNRVVLVATARRIATWRLELPLPTKAPFWKPEETPQAER